jgi:molecular chaperone DnaJ
MNLKEAYTTLELSEGASQDEAKKKYRELTKKWHPDINKDNGAEEKFKKINEAYECIKNGKGNDRPDVKIRGNPFSHFRQQSVLQNVEIGITISFKDSVLGCKREVKYSRQAKCKDCNGQGETLQNNGCKKCGGKGRITSEQRGMIFISDCPECFGQSSTIECKACQGQGLANTDVSVHVSVPAGIQNGNTLRLQGMGNYAGSMMGFVDQYTDTLCHVIVTPEPGLSIEGRYVVSSVTITLLDALRGCERTVKTVFGDRRIQIKPESRNRDEVIIPHHGVGGTGDQKVLLDVQYPKNTTKLIGALVDEVI